MELKHKDILYNDSTKFVWWIISQVSQDWYKVWAADYDNKVQILKIEAWDAPFLKIISIDELLDLWKEGKIHNFCIPVINYILTNVDLTKDQQNKLADILGI